MKNDEKTIEDGFGNAWSITCPRCGDDSMSVVRPGKVQCDSDKCYLMDRIMRTIDRYDIDREVEPMLKELLELIHEERKAAAELALNTVNDQYGDDEYWINHFRRAHILRIMFPPTHDA